MNWLGELVATGEIDVVLTTERDLFRRGLIGLTWEDFSAYGTEVRDLGMRVENVDK